jgi:acetyl esterase/lipase
MIDGVSFANEWIDPQLLAPLPEILAGSPRPVTADNLADVRRIGADRALTDDELRRGGTITLQRRRVPGPDGAPDLDVLILRPAAPPDEPAAGDRPCVYYIHGGGLVAGDERSDMGVIGDWVQQLGVVVVSVRYRLAPEHPYPAPGDDCAAGLRWTAAHRDELGGSGPLVVAGTSAGGGLAAATVLRARDQGGPAVDGQLLMCPMLDDRTVPAAGERPGPYDTWSRVSNLTGWTALLGDARGSADVSPYAAPARAGDHTGLPPTFVDVGSLDAFRDEDVDYARRIWAAGGDAELHVWTGGYHGFDALVADADVSAAARAARIDWLRRLLSRACPPAG